MLNKWKTMIVLCAVMCLLSACGRSGEAELPTDDAQEIHHFASSENWVYIEFDTCYPPEDIQISLTPASSKDQSSEIPLTFYPSINGCVLTLEEGAYCIQMRCSSQNAKYTQERYFVVDEEHSYYHILFSPKVF